MGFLDRNKRRAPLKRTSSKPSPKDSQQRLILKALLVIGIFSAFLLVMFFSDFSRGLGGCVAVISVDGEISMHGEAASLFSPGKPNAEDVASTIIRASKQPNVKAILLKINSPGGSVVGSRIIRHAIEESDKPVVAYLTEVAASGGYYVASGADYIVSDPNTITGSIGVLTVFVDARDLLEKLGVNVTAVTAGKHKTMGAFFRGLNEEDREIVERIVNSTYREFIEKVEEGRGARLNKAKFLAIADGRIISGREAYSIGMVDALGYEEDALRKAAELGNLSYSGENPPTCKFVVRAGSGAPLAGMKSSTLFTELADLLSGGLKFS